MFLRLRQENNICRKELGLKKCQLNALKIVFVIVIKNI